MHKSHSLNVEEGRRQRLPKGDFWAVIPQSRASCGLWKLVAGRQLLLEFVDSDSLSIRAFLCMRVLSICLAPVCTPLRLCAHAFSGACVHRWVPQGHLAHFTTSGPGPCLGVAMGWRSGWILRALQNNRASAISPSPIIASVISILGMGGLALPLLGAQSRVDCPVKLPCCENVPQLSISGSTVVLTGTLCVPGLGSRLPGVEVGALWESTSRPSRGRLPRERRWREGEQE